MTLDELDKEVQTNMGNALKALLIANQSLEKVLKAYEKAEKPKLTLVK